MKKKRSSRQPESQAGWLAARWPWLVLFLVILFVAGVRIRLLNIPLERDEGEFAYVGQLMLEGIAPYKMAYVVKLPGTAAVYALGMALFGQTAVGIHLVLLLANIAAIVLVFLLGKRWFGAGVGLVAGTTYGLMSLSAGVVGEAAHATQFVMPVALGGILLLLRGLDSGRLATLFWSGILFGLAFLLKQPGILFGAFGGFCLLAGELKTRPVRWTIGLKTAGVFCLGIILPFTLLCLLLWHAGTFEKFWFWSFSVAGGGWAGLPEIWDNFKWYVEWLRRCWQWPFWCLAGLALPCVFWMRTVQPVRMVFLAFCATSIFAGCVGLRFNPHYFVLTLPAIGMLISLGVIETQRCFKNTKFAIASFLPVTLFVALCGWIIFADQFYLFRATPDQFVVRYFPRNPFREAVGVANYIEKNSNPESRIAVLGSEPEIYFLAHRRSATGHVSTYILEEQRPYSHDMQEEMIREIKSSTPEYIVFVDNVLSWLPPDRFEDDTLIRVMHQYITDRYNLVGVAALAPTTHKPVYYWEAETRDHESPPKPCLFVYRIQKPPP